MQLLDTGLTGQLLEVIEDIVEKVEIKSDFSIHNPDYKPLDLPLEVVERFQKMPNQIQQKYLGLQLRSFIYGIYYNGSMRSALALDAEGNNLPQDLENNSFLGVDLGFYEQLHSSNQGEGYFDSGWDVLREENDGALAVTKGSLRLHIHRDKHLQSFDKAAVVGDFVAIHLPKNRVQNGFYMAVGNQGFTRLEDEQNNSVTVRIYFNFTPEGAVAVMGSLTQQFNELEIPFSFKVLYNPQDYGRHDSGVLYFDKSDYQEVRGILQRVYGENKLHFQSEVPLFTMQLAPGLGLAEEPDQKFVEKESFGMNRCQIVANGLLKAWYQGDNSVDGRIQAICAEFSTLGIDLQRVHLNAGSEDIYQLLA
ncbi:T3SS effector HopA1 family protein [Nodularia spumigena]|uniref:T3SS effector HopA1 family protein n=1 Tax=Nodularia spumigena UHCC 0060 TaxID=3110300 RepID=A0ABU5UVE3_NODSP|nr:T3SS effector HopA1 family protein [Nodularia spumigena]MEA5526896.1 T3SS effector HopA1 family protein [Nodularia spumigena UHCC 0143]MEA5609912.1 T3SS effector HopA1 family protein [Nodularia spumigena UHCC 0060]MEA5613097.1 T3SS effector HopA1 family protein [Nodularia spumigena UHCC 0040]